MSLIVVFLSTFGHCRKVSYFVKHFSILPLPFSDTTDCMVLPLLTALTPTALPSLPL